MKKPICNRDPVVCKKPNGNCPKIGNDGLPVQCVGPWIAHKHDYLKRYVLATSGMRKQFFEKENAIFIDLFSGPGRCVIRDILTEVDSGGMMIANIVDTPFNEYHFIDIDLENFDALKTRANKCYVYNQDSNAFAKELVGSFLQKPYRYHFAYIDPFGVENLRFKTLQELAKLQRMDMFINYPLGAIRRNLDRWRDSTNTPLDEFLGINTWRSAITNKSQGEMHYIILDIFKKQLISLGYLGYYEGISQDFSDPSIRNTKDVELYLLILASKHELGRKIWNSIIRTDPDGQKFIKF